MRYLRLFCCVLLLSVLSLTAFSFTANAEEVEVKPYDILVRCTGESNSSFSAQTSFNPNDEEQWYETFTSKNVNATTKPLIYTCTYVFETIKGTPIIKKGGEVDLSIYNIWFSSTVTLNGTNYPYNGIDSARILLFYSDGSMEYVDNVTYNRGSSLIDIFAKFTPTKDIRKFELILKHQRGIGAVCDVAFTLGEYGTANDNYALSIDQQSEESGLLSGIIGWLKNLFNSIADIPSKIWGFFSSAFDTISNWLSDLFNSIVELPSKIISALEDFFLPNGDNLRELIDEHNDALLSEMGFFGQLFDIMQSSFYDMQVADQQNSIEFPATTIDLPQGNTFTFGGETVSIVPSGFEWLAETCKVVSSIVITILFANGVFNRYEEIVGVEK